MTPEEMNQNPEEMIPAIDGDVVDMDIQEDPEFADQDIAEEEEDLEDVGVDIKDPEAAPAEEVAEEKKTPKKRAPRKKKVEEPKEEAEEEEAEPEEKSAIELERERKAKNAARRKANREHTEQLAENQAFFAGLSALQEAQRTRSILRGEVMSVEHIPLNIPGSPMEYAVMMCIMFRDRYKVLIPFEEFYRDSPIDMATVNLKTKEGCEMYRRRQRQMAEKLYGATVEFIVTNVEFGVERGDYSIAGSRKQALEILETRNFIGLRGAGPIYQAGDEVEGRIISVGNYALRVDVQGVDTILPLRDVTYRYTTNLASEYKVNDPIKVQIDEVKLRKTDGRVVMKINAKAAELRAAKRAQEDGLIRLGAITVGVITSIRPSRTQANKIVIHAYLPYFKMPAVIKAIDPKAMYVQPRAGDQMNLSVSGFSEHGFVFTTCHGYHNASVLFGRG